ncbi:hypothetical protein [Jidongwangia harbinensis]|uniref:hypothetical protein n=1 Tax=Jidongwangia harbinensis TaxID=2878561 RepID=UPI001CD92182|nr:hypothetical protein [Jidongwangia harbinensis]MCA2218007.1 hypothetical protein [Jidongwangia harbinensis]
MSDSLSRWHHVTTVLRLVVDDAAVLSHGEILDPAGNVQKRFPDWNSLVPTLRAVLKKNED